MRTHPRSRWIRTVGMPPPWLVLFLTLISGCEPLGVVAPADEVEPQFRDDVLNSLVGSTYQEVLERFGSPTVCVAHEAKTYFVYQRQMDASGVGMMFVVPVPMGMGIKQTWVCSRLAFDRKQILEEFDIYGRSLVYPIERPQRCTEIFWSKDELLELDKDAPQCEYPLEYNRTVRLGELKAQALQGDAAAQYRYGSQLMVADGWKWICLAAHQNHAKAQKRMGRYYHLERAPVQRDAVKAYVWYSLAERNGLKSGLLVDYVWTEGGWRSRNFSNYHDWADATLTPAQMAEGHRLIAEWQPKPAECEASAAQKQD